MRVTRTSKEITGQESAGSGLIADLGSKDKTVRASAYDSLLAMREEAVPLLVKALADPQ